MKEDQKGKLTDSAAEVKYQQNRLEHDEIFHNDEMQATINTVRCSHSESYNLYFIAISHLINPNCVKIYSASTIIIYYVLYSLNFYIYICRYLHEMTFFDDYYISFILLLVQSHVRCIVRVTMCQILIYSSSCFHLSHH